MLAAVHRLLAGRRTRGHGIRVGLALLFLLAASPMRAQEYDENPDMSEVPENAVVPRACGTYITPSGYIQGHWFSSVRMIKRNGTGNIGFYENVDHYVKQGGWLWIDGDGNYTCFRQNLVLGFYIDYEVLVPPSGGIVVPATDESTGGGSEDDGYGDSSDPWGDDPGYDDGWDDDSGGNYWDCYIIDYYDEYWNFMEEDIICFEVAAT